MIHLDDALGVHPKMVQFRLDRAAVLSSNIANVDTPNYKAMDLKFEAVLSGIGHSKDWYIGTAAQYRIPVQRTRDGNTVELENEQARFKVRNLNVSLPE
ncbi:flagellar basal body protein [Vibrio chagasii]|uniref:Flagellar basal body rod protein FlgB n=1 Tax=Vibrio chagasii TaxID=170679 RepID=A0A7Y3YU40_9VIBR|nr:flagellar basal body protein [Vibrio chagasii]NOH36388.1 flagellar basal body rod protein FlgB [Vibrio chagasii]